MSILSTCNDHNSSLYKVGFNPGSITIIFIVQKCKGCGENCKVMMHTDDLWDLGDFA